MTAAWNDGYFADAPYVYAYHRELNPVFQRFCLVSSGVVPPVCEGTAVHCELGFGQGVSANIHAAANPGSYWGTDFMPAHVGHARQLQDAGASGARWFDDSFEEFLRRDDLPAFESISLHGVWSWITRANQQVIVELARRRLKPGGSMYVSYNCQPGWAPLMPMRQLMAFHERFAAHASFGSPADRVAQAVQFVDGVLASKPAYVVDNPGISRFLDAIRNEDPAYIAGEYFGREWHCDYFADVVEALQRAQLEFAGLAAPGEQFDRLNIGPAGLAQLAQIEHPTLREQVRDYHLNRAFRRDLYVRGARRLSGDARAQMLLDTRCVLLASPDQVPASLTGRNGVVALDRDRLAALVSALSAQANAPKTLRAVIGSQAVGALQPWLDLLAVLVGIGAVAPCQPEDAEAQVSDRCLRLNAAIVQRALAGKELPVLASAATGGGIEVPRLHQIFLAGWLQGRTRVDELAAWASAQLAAATHPPGMGAPSAATSPPPDDLVRATREFVERRLPILRALRIVP